MFVLSVYTTYTPRFKHFIMQLFIFYSLLAFKNTTSLLSSFQWPQLHLFVFSPFSHSSSSLVLSRPGQSHPVQLLDSFSALFPPRGLQGRGALQPSWRWPLHLHRLAGDQGGWRQRQLQVLDPHVQTHTHIIALPDRCECSCCDRCVYTWPILRLLVKSTKLTGTFGCHLA